jgi:predicted DNA-binding transcriptional regulator AlpA
LWSIQDVSSFIGVPVATIYQWRVRGDGPPAMRLGRHLRYDPQTVAEWAHRQQEAGGGRHHP